MGFFETFKRAAENVTKGEDPEKKLHDSLSPEEKKEWNKGKRIGYVVGGAAVAGLIATAGMPPEESSVPADETKKIKKLDAEELKKVTPIITIPQSDK